MRGLTPAVELDVGGTTALVKTLTATLLRHEATHEVERFGTLAKRCEVLRIVLAQLGKMQQMIALSRV